MIVTSAIKNGMLNVLIVWKSYTGMSYEICAIFQGFNIMMHFSININILHTGCNKSARCIEIQHAQCYIRYCPNQQLVKTYKDNAFEQDQEGTLPMTYSAKRPLKLH